MRISEHMSVAELVLPQQKAAAFETDAISLKQYGETSIKIVTGDMGSPVGTPAVTLRQSTDVSKTSEKALGFDFVYVGDAADDTLAKTAVTSDTFTLEENKVYVIELNDSELDAANDFDCFHVEVSDPTVQGVYVSITALSSEARTTGKSVLAD